MTFPLLVLWGKGPPGLGNKGDSWARSSMSLEAGGYCGRLSIADATLLLDVSGWERGISGLCLEITRLPGIRISCGKIPLASTVQLPSVSQGRRRSQASGKGENFPPRFVQKVPDPPLLTILSGTPVYFLLQNWGLGSMFICNSLVTCNVEHLLTCFANICICSLVRCLPRSLPIWVLMNFKSYLYILYAINSIWSDGTFTNNFS